MNPFGRTKSCILIALYTGEKLSRKVSLLSYTGKISSQKSFLLAKFVFWKDFFAFWTTSVRIDQPKMTLEFFWKPTRIFDQFVFSEDGIYNEHIVFLIIFNFWVKNTILSKFFSNKLEFRQCVFIRYQGDRLSKYLNSEVHPRIWQIGKSWKKNSKNKQITSFYLFGPGSWKEAQKARRSFGWWKAWRRGL